jgi:uncharacterized coiled-coil protein SlyX
MTSRERLLTNKIQTLEMVIAPQCKSIIEMGNHVSSLQTEIAVLKDYIAILEGKPSSGGNAPALSPVGKINPQGAGRDPVEGVNLK